MTTTTIERPATTAGVGAALGWTPTNFRARAITFLAICALAILTVAILFQVPYRQTIRVGGANDDQHLRGFFDAEGKGVFPYRWTEANALVRLPQGVFPGEADIV